MFSGEQLFAPLPELFGSQAYNLPTEKSDVDMMLFASPKVLTRSHDLRKLLADCLLHSGVDPKTVQNQEDNATVKWKDDITNLFCSVTINSPSGLYNQLHTTQFLRGFYADHESYRKVVQRVIEKLRHAEVLNSHEANIGVGQHKHYRIHS